MNPDYPYFWLAKTIICMIQMRSTEAQAAAEGLKLLDGSDSLNLQLARIAHGDPRSQH